MPTFTSALAGISLPEESVGAPMTVLGLALWFGIVLAPGPTGLDPSPAIAAEQLSALKPDPAPEQITNGVHYVTSNERRLDLFLPEISHAGGVHLGVGSDQNYILAGWSRPDLIVVVDFDQAVVDMHAIYGALFAAANTPQRFVELWSPTAIDDARQAIRDATAAGARRRILLTSFDEARPAVEKRTRVLMRKYDDLGIHWYLEDQAQYDAVRSLATGGRVIAVRGDFTADGVLRRIGAVLRDAHQPVRSLYLSNIEQYFRYGPDFRANMTGLPMDESTLVLRTLPGLPAGFQYILQTGDNFVAWLGAPKVYSVYRVRGHKKGEHLEASEKFVIDELP